MPIIYIAPFEIRYESMLPPLQEQIHNTFHIETKLLSKDIDPSPTYDPSREQYNSSLLLAKLISILPDDAFRILGVTDLDLFIPILTFVFGEAQLDGPAAIVSSHRLGNLYYGLPKDERLFQERFEKEAIHELGHTFGLIHCRTEPCVMNASTYVENIDLKPLSLCQSCLTHFYEHYTL